MSIALPPEGDTLVGSAAEKHVARTVGHAGQPVGTQHKVLRTAAGPLQALVHPRTQETQRVAATVVLAGVVGRRGLAQRVVQLQVHGPMDGSQDCLLLFTRIAVTPLNGLCLPVGPVQVVLEHAQGKDVVQAGTGIGCAGKHLPHARPIQVADGHVVFARIPKEELVGVKGDGESVRPAQVLGDQQHLAAAIQGGPSDMGPITPVRPVEIAMQRVDCQSTRLLQTLVDEDLAELALQVGHLDCVRSFVAPEVKVTIVRTSQNCGSGSSFIFHPGGKNLKIMVEKRNRKRKFVKIVTLFYF